MAKVSTYVDKSIGLNVRLDEETAVFYRQQAQKSRMTLSAYVRQTLVNGVMANSVEEIEERLNSLVSGLSVSPGDLPDEVLLSIFMSEALLSSLIKGSNIQQFYDAQEEAKKKLAQFKGTK